MFLSDSISVRDTLFPEYHNDNVIGCIFATPKNKTLLTAGHVLNITWNELCIDPPFDVEQPLVIILEAVSIPKIRIAGTAPRAASAMRNLQKSAVPPSAGL